MLFKESVASGCDRRYRRNLKLPVLRRAGLQPGRRGFLSLRVLAREASGAKAGNRKIRFVGTEVPTPD
jgi:hypothetical protein